MVINGYLLENIGYIMGISLGYDGIPGSSKKTAILSNSLRRNLHAPFPPIQCCYIALLRKAFKKNSHFGSDAGMHWATTLIKEARGDQV